MIRKKVFLKLYSALNLGDDLFLKIILERYPNVDFYLKAGKEYKDMFEDKSNLNVFNSNLYIRVNYLFKKNLFQITNKKPVIKQIEKSNKKFFNITDVFVSLGGSIFMQPKILPFYFSIEYYNLVNLYYKQKPKFYIGCNFGPFLDIAFRNEYELIFKNAVDVCFRDKHSKDLFSNLTNVRYKPDVVFGLKVNKVEKEEKSVGFSIISARDNIDSKRYIHKYAELISFYQRKEYKVYLFSFCKKEGDEVTINSILNLLDKKSNVNTVFYDGNIENFLGIYSAVEQMYCGRFHAMILSMLYNQMIYPIIYSDKMTNVLNDICYKGDFILMKDFHLINPKYLFESISLNSYNIIRELNEAKKQFEVLDKYLL